MKTTISRDSLQLLEAHSLTGVVMEVKALPSGRFEIELEDEIADRLAEVSPDADVAIAAICGRLQ